MISLLPETETVSHHRSKIPTIATNANHGVSNAKYVRVVQSAANVLSALNVQNEANVQRTPEAPIVALAVITAKMWMMHPLALILPFCRLRLQFRQAKMTM